MASVPKPTGTTPLYISMRSAKFTGMLLSPKEDPTPSWGTPSTKTFTCLPEKPSSNTCICEPVPPVSLTFTPGALPSTSLSDFAPVALPLVSIPITLYGWRLVLATASVFTTTSCISVVSLLSRAGMVSCAMVVVAHASMIAKPKSFTFSIFTFPFVKLSGCKGMPIPEIPQSPNLGNLHARTTCMQYRNSRNTGHRPPWQGPHFTALGSRSGHPRPTALLPWKRKVGRNIALFLTSVVKISK